MAKNEKKGSKENDASEIITTEAGSQVDTATGEEQTPETKPEENEPEQEPELEFVNVVSGAEFWRFAPEKPGDDYDGKEFLGFYVDAVKREKDGKKEDQKAGSVIGYTFKQYGTELMFIIGKCHAVDKALSRPDFDRKNAVKFVYQGKAKTAAGEPYNRYDIYFAQPKKTADPK